MGWDCRQSMGLGDAQLGCSIHDPGSFVWVGQHTVTMELNGIPRLLKAHH